MVEHQYRTISAQNAIGTPDYSNPKLRHALQNFIKRMGERYDGDPRIGFVTAGLLGTWGEWHTYPRSKLMANKVVQREIMDAYAAAFKTTPILLRYPAGPDDYTFAANHNLPFGYHDDSFAWATLETGRKEDDWFFMPAMKTAKATDRWKRQSDRRRSPGLNFGPGFLIPSQIIRRRKTLQSASTKRMLRG